MDVQWIDWILPLVQESSRLDDGVVRCAQFLLTLFHRPFVEDVLRQGVISCGRSLRQGRLQRLNSGQLHFDFGIGFRPQLGASVQTTCNNTETINSVLNGSRNL